MWSKLTSHLGIWLGLDEPSRPMRASCSLSVLHSTSTGLARSSRSSDNLHRVVAHSSPNDKKGALFTLRRSRNKEKKNPPKTNGMPLKSSDPLTQSWHSQANGNNHTTPTKNIFSFLRSRSRSTQPAPLPSSSSPPSDSVVVSSRPLPSTSSTVSDFSHLRRRRPRSAHFDPNTINLPPKEEELAHLDVDQMYERIGKLGEGSYATVYKCESKIDGSIVALKEIKLQFEEGLPFTAIREASLLKTLRHANIVCLHDIFLQHSQLTFVFEYMKMDLSKYLESHPLGLDNFQTKLLLFQLLRGLDFCHKKKILHRDLKPQNLLLDHDGVLKLADFGLARAKSVPSRTYSNEVVTLWYRPPDVLLGNTDYTTSLDMWGVGCIMAEMVSGQALFPGTKDVNEQLERIFTVRGTPNHTQWPEVLLLPHYVPSIWPSYREVALPEVNSQLSKLQNTGIDLLLMFLQLKPTSRVSASSAMLHPYFSNLPRHIHLLPPTQSIYDLPELNPLHR